MNFSRDTRETSFRPSVDFDPKGVDWERLEALLRVVAELADQQIEIEEFGTRLTAALVRELKAETASLWICDSKGGIQLAAEQTADASQATDGSQPDPGRQDWLRGVAAGQVAAIRTVTLLKDPVEPDGQRVDPPLFAAAPIISGARPLAVVEVLVRSDRLASQPADALPLLLETIAGLCSDFFPRKSSETGDQDRSDMMRWVLFSEEAGRSARLQPTAQFIAEEARRLVGCDRVTVLQQVGETVSALAVSGAPGIERRAAVIGKLEALADGLRRSDWPATRLSREIAGLSPADRILLNEYLDAAGAREVVLLPLQTRAGDSGESLPLEVGAIACDWYTGEASRPEFGWEPLQRIAGASLRNAQRFERIPWSAWFAAESRQKTGGRRIWAWGLGLAAVLGLLPLELQVTSDGVLQPVHKRDVFAPDDAVVEELAVVTGARVAKGELLARLRSSRLDLERQRVEGELKTARERLAALEAARLSSREGSRGAERTSAQLSGDEAGLREQVLGLERQSRILALEFDELLLRSPIDGQVLTWDLEQRILGRPVQRGQSLATIGDPAGPWRLELEVPVRLAGHVAAAVRARPYGVPVRCTLLSNPRQQLSGVVTEMAAAVDIGEAGGPAVRTHARLTTPIGFDARPGEAVQARIRCGLRPAIYVGMHEVIDGLLGWIPW